MLTFVYDSKEKEYDGITKAEVQKIKDSGKIALLEIDIYGAKKINSSSIGANFIGILPPSLDALRIRVKQNTKLNTGDINKLLEKAKEEILEIETYTFFTFRIMNDGFDDGYKDFKNAVISLFPHLKYSNEDIENIKNIKEGPREKKKQEEEKPESQTNLKNATEVNNENKIEEEDAAQDEDKKDEMKEESHHTEDNKEESMSEGKK